MSTNAHIHNQLTVDTCQNIEWYILYVKFNSLVIIIAGETALVPFVSLKIFPRCFGMYTISVVISKRKMSSK